MFSLPLMLLVVAPAADPPKPKWPIGKETTYVTGPLDKEGYVDYEAALNERLVKGVTPETNANVLIWKAIGPRPEGARMHPDYFKTLGIEEPPESGDYFVGYADFLKTRFKVNNEEVGKILDDDMEVRKRPWAAKDHPRMSAWLAANEKPLAVAVEATRRPEYFNPLIGPRFESRKGSLIGALLPSLFKCREFAIALATRAMLRISEGKFDDAWQDLLACHRLGRLVSRGGTLIESLVGLAIDAITSQVDLAYLQHAPLTARQIQDRLTELRRLPPLALAADKIDLGERFEVLQTVQDTRRYGLDLLEGLAGTTSDKKQNPIAAMGRGAASIALGTADWEPALRNANKWSDQVVAAMRTEDRSVREKKLAQLREDLTALGAKASQSGLSAENVGNIVISLLMPGFDKMQTGQDRYEQTRQNLFIAFALAAHRADTGRYPESLAELAPKYLDAVPGDLFSGKPLIYKPSDNGYLLYSVGPNSKDDGGRNVNDDPPGDDLVVRMPLPPLKIKK
jgi:hypothetical protein